MTAPQPPYPSQGYPAPDAVLRAPAGTAPGTVWIWLFVALPIVQLLVSVPMLISIGDMYSKLFGTIASAGSSPSSEATRDMLASSLSVLGPVLWVSLISYVLVGVGIVLGWLDWRALGRRGVPKPFHWAWGFFAFTGAGTLVYLIGRTVVVRGRTGKGLAPLWTGIAIYVAIMIVSIAWAVALVGVAVSAVSVR